MASDEVMMLLILIITAMIIKPSAGERQFSDLREVEILRHLERLNKPAIKSINSPDGDIIDCVPIANQPAFDHPLLKNHTIQMRPSFDPDDVFTGNKISSNNEKQPKAIAQLWQRNGECPENTVPIRRISKEDLLRANSIENYGKKNPKSFPQLNKSNLSNSIDDPSNHQYAIVYAKKAGKYYGAGAKLNVWKPEVQKNANEFSLAQIWIVAGDYKSDLDTVEAGWQVYPHMYGDDNTRFFIFWTGDAYRSTGCYNLICPGFVQTNRKIVIGGTIIPQSTYGGDQYEISPFIWKDPKTGNWWLKYNEKQVVGYWPASLFNLLADHAWMIQWGGEVFDLRTDGQHTVTGMGSGRFPKEGFRKASYFANLFVVDESNVKRNPERLQVHTDHPSCYDLTHGNSQQMGTYFFFGGPGRNPHCL